MNIFSNLVMYIQDFFSFIATESQTKSEPVVPSTSSSSPALTRLTNIILSKNAPFQTVYPPVTGSTINAQIHKIDTATATKMASAILINAPKVNNDSNYLAACIMQESKFDPACFNHNLAEYKGVVSFEGTDWGCCQMSGYYLPSKPGMAGLTEAQMSAKAMSIEWAVPEMASVMHDNLATANGDLYNAQVQLDGLNKELTEVDPTDTQKIETLKDGIEANLITILKEINTTELSNEQFLATLYYNRGATGGLHLVLDKSMGDIQHPFMVGKWYAQFKST